jgi:hypothetical protein
MKTLKVVLAAIIVLVLTSSCEKEEINPLTNWTAHSDYVTSPEFTLNLYSISAGVEKEATVQMRVYNNYTFKIEVPNDFFFIKENLTVGYEADFLVDGRVVKNVWISTKRGLVANNNLDSGYEFITYMLDNSTTKVQAEHDRSGLIFEIDFEINTRGMKEAFDKIK